MATPITVKIPEPITAPMPSAVSDTGPSVFFRACSGCSDSEISLSIDFVRKICLASALAPQCKKMVRGVTSAHCISESAFETCLASSKAEAANLRRYSAQRDRLPLALAARGLADLGFVRATRSGALSLGCRGLACCALYLLALLCVGNALGICHEFLKLSVDTIF